MSSTSETSLRNKLLTTFLSLSVLLAFTALTFRVIRYWIAKEYVGASSLWIAPYIIYHLIDVKLVALAGFLSAVITAILYLVSRKTRTQILLKNYLLIPAILLIFVFAGSLYLTLRCPVDRLVSALALSRKDFIELYDLDNPSLAKMRTSYESHDYHDAENQLIDYYKSKYRGYPDALSEHANPKKVMQAADRALERSFTYKGRTKVFPEKIEWHQGLEADSEWVYLLNRTYWFSDLVSAYLLTSQKDYIHGFAQQFVGWVEKNPLPLWMDERNPAWRLIDTGTRPIASWIDSFKLIINSPDVDDSTKLLMLKSLHDHAQFLFYFRTTGTNHVLIESKGLLTLANEFPEFERAKRWQEAAVRRLDSEIGKQVYPDGGHVELSPDYHIQSLRHFVFPLRYSSSPHPLIGSGYQGKLDSMRDFLFYTLKPDLRLPLLNDTNTKDRGREILKEARLSQRDDLLFIATHGVEGTAPPFSSRAFEDSGVYVMRNGWTESAQYLVFDSGPYGGWHGHEDKLSIELSAFGTPMIVDGGAYRYSGDEEYRAYFVSSAAHNTVLIDGQGQSRRLLEYNRRPERADRAKLVVGNRWFSGRKLDYASGKYSDGYSELTASGVGKSDIDLSATHQRDILYVKNDYYVIADTITGRGTRDVELMFHLPPEGVAKVSNESVKVNYPNGATLNILSEGGGQPDVSIIEGQHKPIQGWFSSDTYEAVPAPVVDVKYRTELPVTIYTLLIPEAPQNKNNNKAAVKYSVDISTDCTCSRACLVVSAPEWEDHITIQTHGELGRIVVSTEKNSGRDARFDRRYRQRGSGE